MAIRWVMLVLLSCVKTHLGIMCTWFSCVWFTTIDYPCTYNCCCVEIDLSVVESAWKRKCCWSWLPHLGSLAPGPRWAGRKGKALICPAWCCRPETNGARKKRNCSYCCCRSIHKPRLRPAERRKAKAEPVEPAKEKKVAKEKKKELCLFYLVFTYIYVYFILY